MAARTVSDYDIAISTYLRMILAERNITHSDFAERMGINYNTIHYYLKGRRPMTAGDLIRAFEVLGTRPEIAIERIRRIADEKGSPAENSIAE